jgi:hypothetical protein
VVEVLSRRHQVTTSWRKGALVEPLDARTYMGQGGRRQ